MANEQGAFKGDEGCLARPFLQRVQGICDSHNLIEAMTYSRPSLLPGAGKVGPYLSHEGNCADGEFKLVHEILPVYNCRAFQGLFWPGKAHCDSYGGSFIQWSLVEPPDFDGNDALRPGAMVGYATEKRRGGISPMARLLGWGALRTYWGYVWQYWHSEQPVVFYASERTARRRRPGFSGMLEPTTDPNERQRAITSLEQDLSRIAQILGNIIEKTVLP